MQSITYLSLFPSIITIFFAFYTRQVLIALSVGIISGGVIISYTSGNLASLNIVQTFIIPALGNERFAIMLLVYLWCLGGIIGIWNKTGSAIAFAEKFSHYIVKNARSSLLYTWLTGFIFHQGATLNTILTSSSVKSITDKYNVSHEELSYVVDSNASPITAIIPFNAWPAVVSSVLVGATSIPYLKTHSDCFFYYVLSIPFNFYCISSVILTLLFIFDLNPFVNKKMQQAITRSREKSQLDAPDSLKIKFDLPELNKNQAGILCFVLPVSILILMHVVPIFLQIFGIISPGNHNYSSEAFILATLAAFIAAKLQGLSLDDIIDGFNNGFKEMSFGIIILGLAFTMSQVSGELHTGDFIISVLQGNIPQVFLPAFIMIIAMIFSFSIGTSLGSMAVILPISLPIAYATNSDPLFLQICFGACMGGSVFGDHCSPISDTTVLTSIFTGCDLMNHVKTQLPFAIQAAIISIIMSTVSVLIFFGWS